MALAYRLDRVLRQLDALLPAEQCQQNQDALMRTLLGKEAEVTGERPPQNADMVAGLEVGTARQLDGTAAFAATDFIDNMIAQPGWFTAGHDYRSHANAPTRIPPSPVLEGNEGVRGEQRPKSLNTAPTLGMSRADVWDIN